MNRQEKKGRSMAPAAESEEYVRLIEECRIRCLWFLAPDAMPEGREEQLFTLDCVQRYGRRDDYIRARRLKDWLSRHSSEAFAVSSHRRGGGARAT